MPKFLIFALLFPLFSFYLCAQNAQYENFHPPLNIPLFLSGNYGELRKTHFHSGIDFKTQSEIGKPVFAAKSGYISRIKIQAEGYGRSLYIEHPDGYTTVYAHLNRFIPELQQFTIGEQYKKKSYEIDLYLNKDQFVITQKQLIAFSGNTGNSGGPHLHFEIRKTAGQIPMNGLKYGFPVKDTKNPVFNSLFTYSYPQIQPAGNIDEIPMEHHVHKLNDSVYFVQEVIQIGNNNFGLGAEVYDYLNGSANKCGIHSMRLMIDSMPVYSFTIESIPFHETRYINAHMDYDQKTSSGKSVHRLFALPNNKLRIYDYYSGNGLYHFEDDSVHYAEIQASDAYGNKSCLQLYFKRKSSILNLKPDFIQLNNWIKWNEGKEIETGAVKIQIPPGALYQDIYFKYSVSSGAPGALSDTFFIHSKREPLQKKIALYIAPNHIPGSYKEKMILIRQDEKKTEFEGDKWSGDRLVSYTRNFGKYFIAIDSVAPEIIPLQFSSEDIYTDNEEMIFKVLDELSGIKKYALYIDGNWALLEYDAKSDQLKYSLDSNRLDKGEAHSLWLMATDMKNNRAVFESQFRYKP